jgi:hypothetical protein
MQEHPEEYSEKQFEELLEDEDIQLFVEEMALVKQAMKKNQKTCVNIDEEWQKFSHNHPKGILRASKRISLSEKIALFYTKNITKKAASFIGITLISGVAFAAIISLGLINNPFASKQNIKPEQRISRIAADSIAAPQSESKDSMNNKPVTFDNAELQTILKQMSEYYHKTLEFKSEKTKRVRLYFVWNKQLTLEQNIELLNSFERININILENQIIVE